MEGVGHRGRPPRTLPQLERAQGGSVGHLVRSEPPRGEIDVFAEDGSDEAGAVGEGRGFGLENRLEPRLAKVIVREPYRVPAPAVRGPARVS